MRFVGWLLAANEPQSHGAGDNCANSTAPARPVSCFLSGRIRLTAVLFRWPLISPVAGIARARVGRARNHLLLGPATSLPAPARASISKQIASPAGGHVQPNGLEMQLNE